MEILRLLEIRDLGLPEQEDGDSGKDGFSMP